MPTKTKSTAKTVNNTSATQLADLKQFSLALVQEIDNLMKKQATGEITIQQGGVLLGNAVKQFEAIVKVKY